MNWDGLTMVARAGGYYTPPFKGYCGVPNETPSPPAIFNVVVGTVIRH